MQDINQSLENNSFHPVITIGRQFGSGGRSIGRLLAERLGFSYYDTELLSKVSERMGFDKEIFCNFDEKKPSIFRSILLGAYGIPDNFHDISISEEKFYKAQTLVIKELSEKGPCVIVGRTADYILRNHPFLVSVFLHAPLEFRIDNILKRGESEDEAQAMEMARKKDRYRERFYNYYTGGDNWGKASNYCLCIDSSSISPSSAVDIIISFLKRKMEDFQR